MNDDQEAPSSAAPTSTTKKKSIKENQHFIIIGINSVLLTIAITVIWCRYRASRPTTSDESDQ